MCCRNDRFATRSCGCRCRGRFSRRWSRLLTSAAERLRRRFELARCGFLEHTDATTTSGRAWRTQASAGQIDLDDLAGSARVISTDGWFGLPITLAVTPLGPSSFDALGDGTIDACVVTGDLVGDGAVTGADLGLLLAAWGACAECVGCPADLDGDCEVGGADLGLLLGAWEG